ncbi:MAG: hypothetical protein GC185_09575 [Alphaproteobacteria bacterium]|nr:hypothetical protein [Alphaproteobacteria bacterium]
MVCPRTPTPHEDWPERREPGKEGVIFFTPDKDAKIEEFAPALLATMKRLKMGAEINFPHFVLEVPVESTLHDVLEAYRKVVPDYLPPLAPTPQAPERHDIKRFGRKTMGKPGSGR